MLKGRSPFDAIYFTERICGICSTAHGFVSAISLENALNIVPDENGAILREIMHGCEFLQNHIRHFYQFAIPDYVKLEVGPGNDESGRKYKLPKDINKKLNSHYIEAFKYSRDAHKMLAILGGKAPHAHGIFVGGATVNIDASKIVEIQSILSSIKSFINNVMIEDINIISKYYPEDLKNGKGYGNFLSYGAFDSQFDEPISYVKSGTIINNVREEFDINKISEDIVYSYYSSSKDILTQGDISWSTDINKSKAYSWVKAARYNGLPMEVGPLARLWINGEYTKGISTLDRTMARVIEAQKICDIMENLLSKVKLKPSEQKKWEIPNTANGIGVRDTTRGGLATVLNEIIQDKGKSILLNEGSIPVKDEISAICEILGLDPLYIANEGKLVLIVSKEDSEKVLNIMKSNPIGKDASLIGEVINDNSEKIYLKTKINGTRILGMSEEELIPRIC